MTPMRIRGLLFAGLAFGLLFGSSGCGSKPEPERVGGSYPVRSDWLVTIPPSAAGNPSRWYDPGFPPLVMLDRPHATLAGDDARLVAQTKNRVILNTRDVEPALREEFGKVLTELYGTPDDPKVPNGESLIQQAKLTEKLTTLRGQFATKREELAKLQSDAKTPEDQNFLVLAEKQSNDQAAVIRDLERRIANLQTYESDLHLDADTLRAGGVLYRNYCQQCHGLTGDGNGPGGRYLVPLPRDYRQGLFKFITTDPSLGSKRKPRRADLYRTITQGLPGSPMPQFAALREAEVQSIISYVIHLSMRGEAEYDLMKRAADAGGDEVDRKDIAKGLVESASIVAPLWAATGVTPLAPDPNPYITDEQKLESAANGHRLFMSADVGCTSCHSGFGRTAPFQFDSWGSLVRPRNLTVATFRGGRKPEEIYARIAGGILGSNMPAHDKLRPTFEEKIRHSDRIWDLVHFVQYVSESEKRALLREKKQIDIE